MSKVCVPGGQVPSGHLFESLTFSYIVSEITPPDLNPHTACSTRVEPPRSRARGCTNASDVRAISDRRGWTGQGKCAGRLIRDGPFCGSTWEGVQVAVSCVTRCPTPAGRPRAGESRAFLAP